MRVWFGLGRCEFGWRGQTGSARCDSFRMRSGSTVRPRRGGSGRRTREARRERHPHAESSVDPLFECYAPLCSPSREAAAREQIAAIEAAFDKLSENQREVVLLSRIVGLSNAEIAARPDKSEGSVRVLLCRGLARLAELLARIRGVVVPLEPRATTSRCPRTRPIRPGPNEPGQFPGCADRHPSASARSRIRATRLSARADPVPHW